MEKIDRSHRIWNKNARNLRVQSRFNHFHVLFAVFQLTGEYLDGVDFSAQFTGEETHDVPEEYGKISFAVRVAFEQALGEMPVY